MSIVYLNRDAGGRRKRKCCFILHPSPFILCRRSAPGMQVLIGSDEIARRVRELAGEVARDYQGRPVTIIGVLTGCLIFLADLVRRLDLPLRIHLVQASSYRGAVTTPGQLELRFDTLPELAGRDVLLVDDILDTGQTISKVV